MAHKIFAERIELRGEPAWHKLGNVFPQDQQVTLVEATKRVVDYSVLETPVYAYAGGEYILIKDRKALVRTPTVDDPIYRPFEVVSQGYKTVDEFVLADIFNEISLTWPVETIGVLNHGQTLFATLDAGMTDIKGDLMHQFFLLTDSKDRRSATIAAYTPMRTVCWNTLTSGLTQATLKMNVSHRGNNQDNLRRIAATIEQMQAMVEMTNSLFRDMAEARFSLDQFRELLRYSVYPDPVKPVEDNSKVINVTDEFNQAEFERMLENQQAHRIEAETLFTKFNDEHSNVAGTKWAAWNAIVELEDWKPGRGQKRFTSAVFGQRAQAKEKALEAILK